MMFQAKDFRVLKSRRLDGNSNSKRLLPPVWPFQSPGIHLGLGKLYGFLFQGFPGVQGASPLATGAVLLRIVGVASSLSTVRLGTRKSNPLNFTRS